jgi:hypothetical protein
LIRQDARDFFPVCVCSFSLGNACDLESCRSLAVPCHVLFSEKVKDLALADIPHLALTTVVAIFGEVKALCI